MTSRHITSDHALSAARPGRYRPAALVGAIGVAVPLALTIGTGGPAAAAPGDSARPAARTAAASIHVVPKPVRVRTTRGERFRITERTKIVVAGHSTRAAAVAKDLATTLRRSTGFPLPVTTAHRAKRHSITFRITHRPAATTRIGREGYRLRTHRSGVRISATTAAGLFHGEQTLLQLLPPRVMSATEQAGPWTVPGVRIVDYPRFSWRGAMLDVSRHFFPVSTVKRYIDEIAMYKLNVLHLHLSDDQGWRIAIKSWPRLATYGGSTEVGGGEGGYYTQAEFRSIVRYAARHFITIVPEIDTPGHTNAALASYARLNCDNTAPPLYTGTEVGFSSLCVDKEITYRFLNDVIGELAALTPAKYIHIGGDEAHSTPLSDYVKFIGRVQPIVHRHGKNMIGWNEIAQADVKPSPKTLAQNWSLVGDNGPISDELATDAVSKGVRLVMSPANKAYLDMQYNPNSPYGLHWAGYVPTKDSYDWDPATVFTGVTERNVKGVEAPLWSETLTNLSAIEFMAFPRLPGIAEIGWSKATGRSWSEYRERLAAQGPRWEAMGMNSYRDPDVPWPAASR